MDLGDFGLVLARSALERLSLQFSIKMLGESSTMRWKVTYAIGVMRPQMSQIWTLKASETSNNLSFKKALAP